MLSMRIPVLGLLQSLLESLTGPPVRDGNTATRLTVCISALQPSIFNIYAFGDLKVLSNENFKIYLFINLNSKISNLNLNGNFICLLPFFYSILIENSFTQIAGKSSIQFCPKFTERSAVNKT